MARTKHAQIYGLGVVKKGKSYQPLTATTPYRKAPNKSAMSAVNKSLVARAKVNVNDSKGLYSSRKAYSQALKSANAISRSGGYRYAGTTQTQYGMAVRYKPTRAYKRAGRTRRTRRNYKGQFAGSY